VELCHWGCKQSSGGAMLLKQKMREIGMPMLILDGDAVDRRNNHDGQIRTRFEAFLEVLDREKGAAG
jgi:benzoyl-CoA reductase/2-hydroxyglutaryl-CoA dehydratase subunit BcrC/BadD/HgdB